MRFHWMAGLGLAAVGAVVLGAGVGAQSGPYAKVGEIHIGGAARFDYLNVDPAGKRLYVSHGTEAVVIDVTTNTVVGRIPDTPGIHGIAIAPGVHGFTSNGGEDKVSMFDLTTLATLSKIPTGKNPDFIAYEPKMKEVYALNHSGGSATVIDALKGTVTATIPLSGDSVEAGGSDPGLGRMYINIESKSVIDVVDVTTHKVVATWPVAPADGPTGVAVDTKNHRVFSGGGEYTVMLDGKTGQLVDKMKICSGTDATWFDEGTMLLFSSCGDGTITIAHEDSPTKLTVVQTLQTVRGARTMAVDMATHKVYVVGQDYQAADASAAAASAAPAGRGGRGGSPAVADSFKVLVFGMSK